MSAAGFRVGVSRDFLDADGRNVWGDIRLGELDAAGVDWHYLPRDTQELLAADVDGLDAVLFAGPAVTARTFEGAARPLSSSPASGSATTPSTSTRAPATAPW